MRTGPKPRTREQIFEMLRAKTTTVPAPYGLEHPCKIYNGQCIPSGYARITFNSKTVYVHRFVCDAPDEAVVRHKCDRPACWEESHLDIGTHAENVADKVTKGRHSHGTKHYRTELTEADVHNIRQCHTQGMSLKDNAARHCVGLSCIKSIVYGRSWCHVS